MRPSPTASCLILVGLAACDHAPGQRTPLGADAGHVPARASGAPTKSTAPRASAQPPVPSWCSLDSELQALTSTALDPDRAARELKRVLLDPTRAEEMAGAAAAAAVRAIASGAYTDLAKQVNPARGLCLRPAKGAPCRQMSKQELETCRASSTREHWDVDDGSDTGPSYSCQEAFSRIFFARNFLKRTAVRYNCFPELGRGNNAATILSPPAHQAYVEYYAAEQEPASEGGFPAAWRSLWLVFDREGERPQLVELIAEYQGP